MSSVMNSRCRSCSVFARTATPPSENWVLLVETSRRANLEANHIDLKLNRASKRKPFRKMRINDLNRSERFMVYYWFLGGLVRRAASLASGLCEFVGNRPSDSKSSRFFH